MRLSVTTIPIQPANPWRTANGAGIDNGESVIVQLTDTDGVVAVGEAAPAAVYGETVAGTVQAIGQLDVTRLSFSDVAGAGEYLMSMAGLPVAAICAVNTALMDGAAKHARQPLYDFLKLGFREHQHVTSFSIGIDTPEIIREKVAAAAQYPVLKLKVGDPRDHENFAALRSVAPDKPVRVDANEGWKTKEKALRMLEWLMAEDRNIQFVEQPMPRSTPLADLVWLKERSPLPVFADESCHTIKDIAHCAEGFHGVNVKLIKTGGVSMAYETLRAARKAGLKTMIGCMIETSVLISAAACLSELADYLDLDGNLLIKDDPHAGVTAANGVLSFADARERCGHRAGPR